MAKKIKLTAKEQSYLEFDDMFDSLPDGAYFAAMAEQGFDASTIIELSESIASKEAHA